MTAPLKKVLVVDDNEIDLKKMGSIFEQEGVDVAYAHSGVEAAKWLKKNGNTRLDAIICDVMMPEMNGIELSQLIGGNFPLILVSDEGELPLLTDEYLDLVQAFVDKSDCEQTLFNATIKAQERWSQDLKIPMAA
ncbi:MAG: response regulator [Deltaproteobacteria bacterium]|nr:MAG: response regulator [Deltaproteobacteria bacterium]